jgi:hypothetical protein
LVFSSCSKEETDGIEFVKPTFTLTSPSQAVLSDGVVTGSTLMLQGTAADNRMLEKITLTIQNKVEPSNSTPFHNGLWENIHTTSFTLESTIPTPADATPETTSLA